MHFCTFILNIKPVYTYVVHREHVIACFRTCTQCTYVCPHQAVVGGRSAVGGAAWTARAGWRPVAAFLWGHHNYKREIHM